MRYYSLNNKSHEVSFQQAVIAGLAPDKGLYFPESITPLADSFFANIEKLSHEENTLSSTGTHGKLKQSVSAIIRLSSVSGISYPQIV